MTNKKCCTGCGMMKPLEDYHKNKAQPDGHRSRCKTCCCAYSRVHWKKHLGRHHSYHKEYKKKHQERLRDVDRKKRYGITRQQFEQMIVLQDDKCAICRRQFIHGIGWRNSNGLKPFIDHDHKTGRARGLLCTRCNGALGLLYDDVVALENAIKYLKAYQ